MQSGQIEVNPSVVGQVDIGPNETIDSQRLSLRGVGLTPGAPLPEPGGLALASLALAGLLVGRRRG